MKKIALIYRKHTKGYSIENLFKPFDNLDYIERTELPCEIKSFKSFLIVFFFLLKIKSKIIHITGDVNYVTFLLFWKKSIITIHDLNHYEYLRGIKRSFYGLFWFYFPLLCANRIIVISPSTKSQLENHFKISKKKCIDIIPNFFYRYKCLVKDKPRSGDFKILSIGSAYNKNLFRLIESIKNIDKTSLTLISKQSSRVINKLNTSNIKYCIKSELSIEEMEQEYNKADMLYFASTKEGFGLPILEAQSAGLVVLTSNTSSMPYVAGEGALLVDPFDVNEIRKAIEKIIENKEHIRRIREKGFENIKRFNKSEYIEKYVKVYKELTYKNYVV